MKTIVALLLFCLSAQASALADVGSVDLHTHVFMDQGIPWFRGSFNEALASKSWKTRFASQINPETLDKSGLQIVVAALYAFPLSTVSRREAIRHQIASARTFVAGHTNWILARSSQEARAGIAQGKRIMVLSLEGADGVLETEADLHEFIDEDGICIVTPIHLSDDEVGGAAFLRSYHSFSDPFAILNPLQHGRDVNGVLLNEKGLTRGGLALIKKLIARHVWIDLSHSSDLSQKVIAALLEEKSLPFLYTHTVLRKYYRAERAISPPQLKLVKSSGGILGVLPSEEELAGTDPLQGFDAFSKQYDEFVDGLGSASQVMVGTDFNGGVPHLRPTVGSGTSLDKIGFQNISQEVDLWTVLRQRSTRAPSRFDELLETFLRAWERVAKSP